ncbi:MAG TPA: hypothetical protein EYP54_04835 [Anaerolineales bacterium]|nr:hypothetical protein [Anaerolineales bacterium]
MPRPWRKLPKTAPAPSTRWPAWCAQCRGSALHAHPSPAARRPAIAQGSEAAGPPPCRTTPVDLIGAWVKAGTPENAPFPFTDLDGNACKAAFADDVQPLFTQPGVWFDSSPPCTTCHGPNLAAAQKGLNLATYDDILAGAGRQAGQAKGEDILSGGNWEQSILYQQLITRKMPPGRPPDSPAKGPEIYAGH